MALLTIAPPPASAQAAAPRTWVGAGVAVQPDHWLGIFGLATHETSRIALEGRFFTAGRQEVEFDPQSSREIALLVGPRRSGHRVLWGIAAGVASVQGNRLVNRNTWDAHLEPYGGVGAAVEAQVIVRISDGFGIGLHGIGDVNAKHPWVGLALTLDGGFPERRDQ